MNFVTMPVLGKEHKAIDEAILRGLAALRDEVEGPVILVDIIPTVIPCLFSRRVYVTVMAKPYEMSAQETGVSS